MSYPLLRRLPLLALLSACNGGPPPATPTPPAPTPTSDGGSAPAPAVPTTLMVEDSGKGITLAVGAALVVKLRANSGTGYTWDVTKGDPSILAVQAMPTSESLEPGKPGAPVVRAFTFVGKAPGTTRLELAYRRAWERDVAPLQTFTADVTVK